MSDYENASLYADAHAAGELAATVCVPKPMYVKYNGTTECFEDGACGFASIIIRPARGKFVSYLKKNKIGDKHWQSGWSIFVSGWGQSYERKTAYARAFARILNESGLKAHVESRLD